MVNSHFYLFGNILAIGLVSLLLEVVKGEGLALTTGFDELWKYELYTRQLPPKEITLLEKDVLSYYLFDYTAQIALGQGVSLEYSFQYNTSLSFVQFVSDKREVNQTHFNFVGEKMTKNKPEVFNYTIQGTFTKGNKTKVSHRSYSLTITLIDKYKANRVNFRNFQEGFVFRMRSNESEAEFPLDDRDILGNDLNVTIKQVRATINRTTKSSPTSTISIGNSSKRLVKVKIKKRLVTQAVPFYYRQENYKVVAGFEFSLTSYINLVQRIDLPYKFQVKFINYDLYGNTFKIVYLRFDLVEWIRVVKVTDYFFILFINFEENRHAMISFQIKMEKTSPLQRTNQFYPDYGYKYFLEAKKIRDASYLWINDQVIWIYKLMERELDPKTKAFKPHQILIERLFIPAVTKTKVGSISLGGLAEQLKGKIPGFDGTEELYCDKLHVINSQKQIIRCHKTDQVDNQLPKKYHILLDISKITNFELLPDYRFSVEEVISASRQETNATPICFITYEKFIQNPTSRWYPSRPYTITYYEKGVGFFTKSNSQEHVELLNDDEIDQSFEMTDFICNKQAFFLLVRYERAINSTKRTPDRTSLPIKSEVLIKLLNLRRKERGDRRVLMTIRRESPLSKDAKSRKFTTLYTDKDRNLVIESMASFFGQMTYLIRDTVDLDYPKITLSSNSTQNFTAKLKIYNNNQAMESGGYGFPFKVVARTDKKVKISIPETTPVLKNGKYNLEEYIKIDGPCQSIQRLQNYSSDSRLKFRWRAYAKGAQIVPDLDYIHMFMIDNLAFFGVSAKQMVFFDFINNSTSYLSYEDKISSIARSVTEDESYTFFMLFYDRSNQYPLSVGMADAVIDKEKKNRTKLTQRQRSTIKASDFLSGIDVEASDMFIQSLVKGVAGVILKTKDMVKLMILQIRRDGVEVVDTIVYTRTQLGTDEVISAVEIFPLISKPSLFLKAFTLLIGTKRSIIAASILYWPTDGGGEAPLLKVGEALKTMRMNSRISQVECHEKNRMKVDQQSGIITLSRRCEVVVRDYIVQTIMIKTEIKKSVTRSGKTGYDISAPEVKAENEYMMPRYFKAVSCFGSRDYIAVLARHDIDYHMDVLVYKRGYPYVWVALYASYESYPAYIVYQWEGRTWIDVKDVGSNIGGYQIGNMSLEVEEGYVKKESLKFLYSEFGDMSVVDNLTQMVEFSEWKVKKSSVILVVYASIGGFFGSLILLCFCCCLGRCVYECVEEKYIKRQKVWVPVLVKNK